MHCEEARTILLDYDWDADGRRRAMLVLRHLDGCDACRSAVDGYDRLRATLRRGPVLGADEGDDNMPEPPGGWQAFLERLEPTRGEHSLRLRPRPSGGRAAALAACVLLAAAAFQVGRTSGRRVVVVAPTVPPQASTDGAAHSGRSDDALLASLTPSAEDAARQARAFDQLSEVFDRKAGWLMTSSGGASDIGLASDTVPAGEKLLMLRLTLLHAGEVASNADVVIVPGQSADLSLPMADGRALKYHIGTSAGEPTELTLWLEVQTPAGSAGGEAARGNTLAALSTNLRVRPGERVAAGELATTAGRYELKVGFTQAQSASPPAGKRGGAP